MNTPTAPQPLRTGVLILAAGAGRRMGGRAKCLLEVQGQSLLERLVRAVRGLGLHTPVLVLGHHAAEIQAHLAQWPGHLTPRQVVNSAPEDDPASSLHQGLRALDADVQAVMVLLADQPLIDAADIGAVLHAFQRRPPGCQVLVPTVNGAPGHPVMFDAAVRADLLPAPRTGLLRTRKPRGPRRDPSRITRATPTPPETWTHWRGKIGGPSAGRSLGLGCSATSPDG